MQRAWVVSADYRTLIASLAEIRTGQGVSQRELARRLGKPPSFVNKIENVERRLDVLEFIAITQALGISPSKMIATLSEQLPERIEL